MLVTIYQWRLKGKNPIAQGQLPQWKMTEREALLFGAHWGVELEKAEGSAETVRQKAPDSGEQDLKLKSDS